MGDKGPSLSLVENRSTGNAGGVGNYKGVMLCNRPFAGTVGKQANAKSGEPQSFTCGVVPEALGQTVLPSSKEKFKIFRSKKDSVLSKHRRWLAELQKTKDTLEARYVAEMQQKEEAKRQFIEHEAKLRQLTKQMGSKESENTNPESTSAKEVTASTSPTKSVSKAPGKASRSKPAWAMSEKQASSKAEDDLDGGKDAEDLLKFVDGLSYEKYIGDIEVQSMVDKLKRRIAELEREVAQEDMREEDAEERARLREGLAAKAEDDDNDTSFDGPSEDEELNSAARALLQDDSNMQSVHSTKSVTVMMKAARDRIADSKGKGVVQPSNAANEPMIVVHDPSEGTRLDGKNAISNLPYMHRNPAV